MVENFFIAISLPNLSLNLLVKINHHLVNLTHTGCSSCWLNSKIVLPFSGRIGNIPNFGSQSPFQKLKFDNSSQKHAKVDIKVLDFFTLFQIFLAIWQSETTWIVVAVGVYLAVLKSWRILLKYYAPKAIFSKVEFDWLSEKYGQVVLSIFISDKLKPL